MGPGRPAPGARTGRGARGRTTQGAQAGWRYWWEFNRESVIGIRHVLHRRATLTGTTDRSAPDGLRELRGEVLETLHTLAGDRRVEPGIRAAALVALGRAGSGDEARLFVRILRDAEETAATRNAAALALGLLDRIEDPATRDEVRDGVLACLSRRRALPTRTRGLLTISVGLRAKEDKGLVANLAQRVNDGATSTEDAAALAFACGLAGDPLVVPELFDAATRSRFGGLALDDVSRAHAALGLGRIDDPAAAVALAQVLRSRRAGLHTRRSAALALGRLLRGNLVHGDRLDDVRHALAATARAKGDTVLRGFAVLALAGAPEPRGIRECRGILDGGARADLKPYAALALGLAARHAEADEARRIRALLARELARCRDNELESALCLALGLAGAREALPELLDRVANASEPSSVRGAAANGVGLLGANSARAEKALGDALRNGPGELVGEAALGLGLLGRRSVVGTLLDMMPRAGSSLAHGRIVLALGYLGHHNAVAPLLELLRNEAARPVLRAQAAIALGLLGDGREVDALFELGADFNYYATTASTHELLDQM